VARGRRAARELTAFSCWLVVATTKSCAVYSQLSGHHCPHGSVTDLELSASLVATCFERLQVRSAGTEPCCLQFGQNARSNLTSLATSVISSHHSTLIGPSCLINALAGRQQRTAAVKNTSKLPLTLLGRNTASRLSAGSGKRAGFRWPWSGLTATQPDVWRAGYSRAS
jgi:hypothetical protein